MRNSLLFCLIIISSSFLSINKTYSQTKSNSNLNTIYVELLGNGLMGSINYERQIVNTIPLKVRAGLGFYEFSPTYLTFPVGINYLLKLKSDQSFIDFGAGVTYTKGNADLYVIVDHHNPNNVYSNNWSFIPSIGYRRHTKNNLMFRFSATPLINKVGLIPHFGISIGKVF